MQLSRAKAKRSDSWLIVQSQISFACAPRILDVNRKTMLKNFTGREETHPSTSFFSLAQQSRSHILIGKSPRNAKTKMISGSIEKRTIRWLELINLEINISIRVGIATIQTAFCWESLHFGHAIIYSLLFLYLGIISVFRNSSILVLF